MKNIYLYLIVIFLDSCQFSPPIVMITEDIIKIDIAKKYPSKDIQFNTFRNREYVPLETNDDVLLDRYAMIVSVSEKYILVKDLIDRSNIYVFDRNGKIISLINRRGNGPQEYTSISDVVFDEKNNEIFVFNNYGADGIGYILVYSLTGEYKRKLKYPANFILKAYNFNDETILVYDIKNLYNDNYNKKPYMLLSKKDGSITFTLNINLPVRYDTKEYIKFTDKTGQLYTTSSNLIIPNKRHFGEDFLIGDISSDTIYRLTNKGDLKPFIVRTPSVHSTNPHVACTPAFISDKFIILHIVALDYELLKNDIIPSEKRLMYEFETGEIYSIDHWNCPAFTNILQKNINVSVIDAAILKQRFKDEMKLNAELIATFGEEDKKRFEKLEHLIKAHDDEDNPIVMIDHFNEY